MIVGSSIVFNFSFLCKYVNSEYRHATNAETARNVNAVLTNKRTFWFHRLCSGDFDLKNKR